MGVLLHYLTRFTSLLALRPHHVQFSPTRKDDSWTVLKEERVKKVVPGLRCQCQERAYVWSAYHVKNAHDPPAQSTSTDILRLEQERTKHLELQLQLEQNQHGKQ